jgi:surface protein
MFYGASKFNQPLNNWNVEKINNISYMFTKADNFKQYLGDWKLQKDFLKPHMHGITFDEHNIRYQFTKERLIQFIEKYVNGSEENKDKNKYQLMKFIKNFQEFDFTNFSIICKGIIENENYNNELNLLNLI